ALDCVLGAGTEAPVDRTWCVTGVPQSTLQDPNAPRITRAWVQHRRRGSERTERTRTSDPVDLEPVGRLKADDRRPRERTEQSVDWSWRVSHAEQPTLERFDRAGVAIVVSISAANRQQPHPDGAVADCATARVTRGCRRRDTRCRCFGVMGAIG